MPAIVETKRTTMSTVHAAIASIADHLRLIITPEYNPCHGPLLKQMLRVLVPMAAPAQQKKEVTWPQLQSIAELASASGDGIALRASCMIMLAYHAFLRI
jgi:integrase